MVVQIKEQQMCATLEMFQSTTLQFPLHHLPSLVPQSIEKKWKLEVGFSVKLVAGWGVKFGGNILWTLLLLVNSRPS